MAVAADWTRATSSSFTYQNTATTNKPSGVSAGDLLVFFLIVYDSTTTTATINVTATNTIPVVRQTTGEVIALFSWTRVIDGTEGATFGATPSVAGYYCGLICVPVTGGPASAPLDTSSPANGRASTQNLPAITTAGANELLVAIKVGYNQAISSNPANYTPRNTYDGVIRTFDRSIAAAGTVASQSLTVGATDGYCSLVLAIKPAGGGSATLAPANATHGHAAGSPALTQHHVLAPADAAHGHAAGTVALTQHHALTVANATHGQAASSPTLGQAHVLAVDGATHGQEASTPTLTQAHVLVISGATHSHEASAPTITQVHALAVDDASHGHTATTVVLVQVHVLAPADAGHAQAATAVVVVQAHVLVVADATHGQVVSVPSLVQAHVLEVDDASHPQAASSPTLIPAGSLAVDSATHGHTASAVELVQAHVLVVADASHGHAADTVTLAQSATVAPSSATHGHAASTVALVQTHRLAPADSTIGHTATTVALGTLALRAVVLLTARAVPPPRLSARAVPPPTLSARAASAVVTLTVREGDTPMALGQTFNIWQRPIITATFVESDEPDAEPVDPPAVRFLVRADPDAEPTVYTWGTSSEVTHPTMGVYELQLPRAEREGVRVWVAVESEGGGLDTGDEGWIRVRRSQTADP